MMKIMVINDGNPDAINHITTCKDVKNISVLMHHPLSAAGIVKEDYRYCMVSGWLDQAELGMSHNLFGQVYVQPGCNVIVRTGKGCCLKKHEYRIDSVQDVLSFHNEVSLLLGLEKV